MIEKVERRKMPHITELKNEIRAMEREKEDGNLYSTFEPQRISKKQRDENIANLFHPGLVDNPQVKI